MLAITGASGAPYAQCLLRALVDDSDVHLHLVVSPVGRRILADELGLPEPTIESLISGSADQVTLYSHNDLGALIASGSFQTDGMIICPCSTRTLAAVAAGLSDNLITRAALVTLKETRKLVLVPREMPLGQIEIANMLRISQAGGVVCPACPGFYMRPRTIDELVNFVVGRILDLFGLPHALETRWNPMHPELHKRKSVSDTE